MYVISQNVEGQALFIITHKNSPEAKSYAHKENNNNSPVYMQSLRCYTYLSFRAKLDRATFSRGIVPNEIYMTREAILVLDLLISFYQLQLWNYSLYR